MGVLYAEYKTKKLKPDTDLNLNFSFYEFIKVQS
jgi:hypothetical protein